MREYTVFYNDDPTSIFVHEDDADWVSKLISWNRKFYEYELLHFIDEQYREQRNIVDIGANIGNHSLFFSKYLKCDHVYSFEPLADNVALFKKNLEQYKDKCTLFDVALGSQEDTKPLYMIYDKNFGGTSILQQENAFEVAKTKVITLDSLHLEDISFMKIDVELLEVDVLKGAKDTVNRCQPMIMLENSFYHFGYKFPDPEPHKDIMEELGYKKIHSNMCNSAMDFWVPNHHRQEQPTEA